MNRNENDAGGAAARAAAGGAITGTRIRERRLERGLAQGALAREAGISPSYLNLIEHNRRRIGGGILLRIAAALGVEAQSLAHGGEAALMDGLREAAGAAPRGEDAPAPELDRIEEFAGRFPGWAHLAVATLRRAQGETRRADALADRLAHDPHLAASLHEVLSVVTAIRSTASILTDTSGLEPEWQARFHRNLGEDSRRLAEGAERLVRYLDDGPGTGSDILSPQDELDRFLAAHDHRFEALEAGGDPADLLRASGIRAGTGAHALIAEALETYARDARALPEVMLLDAMRRHGPDPVPLARALGAALPLVFRRLAALPEEAHGPIGLVSADASGAITGLKPLPGFAVTRLAGACPLWPLFRAAAHPGMMLRQRLHQPDRDARVAVALTAAEEVMPGGVNAPPLLRSYMLLLPDDAGPEPVQPVGTSCRICPRRACRARREPSILPETETEDSGADAASF
ncbi:helix-turn-helix domain-containing protein [Roseovarius aquimarinus]|uniref:Short-chain fatty acyl-CoA regulator family protein n=1 Tax=Roseovarius aquimarinus TaxID=1229156 RepID=A0ABW7I779_9RHOB